MRYVLPLFTLSKFSYVSKNPVENFTMKKLACCVFDFQSKSRILSVTCKKQVIPKNG